MAWHKYLMHIGRVGDGRNAYPPDQQLLYKSLGIFILEVKYFLLLTRRAFPIQA